MRQAVRMSTGQNGKNDATHRVNAVADRPIFLRLLLGGQDNLRRRLDLGAGLGVLESELVLLLQILDNATLVEISAAQLSN